MMKTVSETNAMSGWRVGSVDVDFDGVTRPPRPANEPVRSYAPGTAERDSLQAELKRQTAAGPVDLSMTIGGERREAGGAPIDVVIPHRHRQVLARIREATAADV